MVRHTLMGQLQVLPAGDDEDGIKQITLVAGPNAVYDVPMDHALVQAVIEDLGLTNAELREKRENEFKAMKTRALLNPQGNGSNEGPVDINALLGRQA